MEEDQSPFIPCSSHTSYENGLIKALKEKTVTISSLQ